jgi:RNA polymerase sigma-32 factor
MPRNLDHSCLDVYLQSLRRDPLLSKEEEWAVAAERVKTGSPLLAARLVKANLRLVVSIAREYPHTEVDLLDLIQEGNLGLVHAVGKYDPSRGVRLASYATWWIRAYIIEFLRANRHPVRLGVSRVRRNRFLGLRRERERLENQGKEVDVRGLALSFEISSRDLTDFERVFAPALRLDAPLRGDDAGRTVGELIAGDSDLRPDVRVEADDVREIVRVSLRSLSSELSVRERAILRSRLYAEDPEKVTDLAAGFGVTRERVRQIEAQLKARLRLRLQGVFGDP